MNAPTPATEPITLQGVLDTLADAEQAMFYLTAGIPVLSTADRFTKARYKLFDQKIREIMEAIAREIREHG